MAITLGEKLRQAREARGMTISQIAEQTRISAHYIEAIENNDFDLLPGGVFNKGFIKLYARCVGLDEQEVIQDYLRQVSEKQEQELKIYKPEVLIDEDKPSKLPMIILAILLIGLIAWGSFALMNYFKNAQHGQKQDVFVDLSNQAEQKQENKPAETLTPVLDDFIKLEFRTLAEKVSVEATIDGKKLIKEVVRDVPEVYDAKESLKIRYYKGFSEQIQLKLNGKPITPPPPPKNRNGIEFEINKGNISRILETGMIEEPPK